MTYEQFDKKCDNYNQKGNKCTGFTFNKTVKANSKRGSGCLLNCKNQVSFVSGTYD